MNYRVLSWAYARRAATALALSLPLSVALVGGAAATSGATPRSAAGGLTPPTQGMTPQRSIGKGEGELNLIAWEGYAQPQWVKPFEAQTGCTVNAKYAGSSSEMVSLMANGGGGQYDLVSASGDADLRLIYGGDVKPVNIKLIPSLEAVPALLAEPVVQHDQRRPLRGLAPVRSQRPAVFDQGLPQAPDVLVGDLLQEVRRSDHYSQQPDPDRRRGAVPVRSRAESRDHRPLRADPDPSSMPR